MNEHENRLISNTTANGKNGKETGTIEGTDAEEVEGVKALSSLRNEGCKE